MAAPVPTFLIPIYSSFRVIVMNLKLVINVEYSFQQLITMRFNSKMASDFDLKNILLRLPINEKDEKLNNWRRMIIEKIDKLEPVDQETMSKYEQIEEETSDDEDSGSTDVSDSDASDDKESQEPPAKKPYTTSGAVKSADPSVREKIVIKVNNPFFKKPAEPTVNAPENTQKEHSGSAVLSSTRLSFEEYMAKNGVELDVVKIKEESAAQEAGMKRLRPITTQKKSVAQPAKNLDDRYLCRKRTAALKFVPRTKVSATPPPPITAALE